MRANNGDHLHRYAGSSGGGGRAGREGEAYIVGGVGSGSDSSPWISCSAVRTISSNMERWAGLSHHLIGCPSARMTSCCPITVEFMGVVCRNTQSEGSTSLCKLA